VKRLFWLAPAIWLTANVFTLTGYPAVWVDEILSADAGIHLAQGKGFVSAAWFNQPSWEFWASYPPLYAFVLAGCLRLFGISAFVVRSFGLSLITVSLLIIFRFLKRLGDDSSRWIVVVALAVCEPLAFLARAGRPDSVSVFLLCATSLVFVERTWRWRGAILFVLGFFAVPAALQFAACVLMLGALLQIWFHPFTRREIALWGTGAACGTAALAGIYASQHVLRIFLESTVASTHSSAGRLLQNLLLRNGAKPFVLSDIVSAPLRDYASPVVIVSGVIVWLVAKRLNNSLARQLSSFGLACAVVIPLAIQLLGKYPIYYAYMGTVPATMAIVAACGRLASKGRYANALVLALLFIGGAGQLWWKGWSQGTQTVFDIFRQVSKEDTVVADYPAYYQLLEQCRELFAVGYGGGKVMPHFPAGQGDRVTKLLVRDSMFAEVAKKVGGQWNRIGDVIVIRHDGFSRLVVIDDDTRKADIEPMGIYARSTTRSTTTAVP
jgi:hypothetical protein